MAKARAHSGPWISPHIGPIVSQEEVDRARQQMTDGPSEANKARIRRKLNQKYELPEDCDLGQNEED